VSDLNYRFCPYCGVSMELQEAHGALRPVCSACGFTHFHDPKVAVIALVASGERVLLIRRGVDPERGKWALPGGFMDAGEMPEEALARELAEEVGLDVRIERFLGIFRMAPLARSSGGIVIAYQASIDAEQPSCAARGQDDALEARWFTPDDLPIGLAFDSTVELLRAWRDGELQRTSVQNTGKGSSHE